MRLRKRLQRMVCKHQYPRWRVRGVLRVAKLCVKCGKERKGEGR